jgi:glycerol uptake facilitator-like aquaporin
MYMKTPYPEPSNYQPVLNPGHSIFVSCALFLALCFSGQLTGGHCNPSVTLTLLISKGNKITPKVATVYICSQFLGAILGGLLAWAVIDNFTVPQPDSTSPVSFVKIFFG